MLVMLVMLVDVCSFVKTNGNRIPNHLDSYLALTANKLSLSVPKKIVVLLVFAYYIFSICCSLLTLVTRVVKR
ncbi:MAG: hypothetical protein ACI83H_002952 [Glaciecola sp.]|jgi:hypothetical protein